MDHPSIFSATLGLSNPWHISSIKFSKGERRLDLTVEYHCDCGNKELICPCCGHEASILTFAEETWHHDDFFQFAAFLHARVPLVECTHGCGNRKLEVPWARPGTRFCLLEPPAQQGQDANT